MKQNDNLIKSLVVTAVILIIVFLYSYLYLSNNKKPLNGELEQYGKADIGGEFVLTDQYGNIFSTNQLKGAPTIVYFGFSYCPDICPTALSKITEAKKALDKYNIKTNVVFITIDPDRDSAGLLKDYLNHFDSDIIGLTGTRAEIEEAANKFKVYYEVAPNSGTGENDYLINHSSFIYIMDKDFNYSTHFHLNSDVGDVVNHIRLNFRN